MKRSLMISVLVLVLASNSVLAQADVNYPSEQVKEAATTPSNQTKTDLGWGGVALMGALSAAFFYEDHIQPLKEGQDPEFGNHRIIFSAAFNKSEAFHEGQHLGGSVREAKKLCDGKKAHFETTYGDGICERIVQYAPSHHFWGEMRAAMKLWFFIVPASVLATLVATCTGVCVVKKIKQA